MLRRIVRSLLALLIVLSFGATPASAQTVTRGTATVTANAPIYIGPAVSPTPLRVAAPGTVLRVMGQEGDWFQVEFNDPQWGPRVGWVQRTYVEVRVPELEPMDLSVRDAVPVTAPTPVRQSSQTTSTASGRTAWREKGWIDVNVGFASSAQSSLKTTATWVQDQETATASVTYSSPTGVSFDFGGGGMLTETFGIGVSFVGTAHEAPAQLSITIPHPTRFNASASDSKETDGKLQRVEGSVNIQLMIKPKLADSNVRFRLFGGPTYFRLQADAVSDIIYDQSYLVFGNANVVKITSYETVKTESTGWGFHVGGDFSYFFTRVFGIGGFARYSKATLTVSDPDALADGPVDVKAGGFQGGGGIRFRF
jgi:hypothetical protein